MAAAPIPQPPQGAPTAPPTASPQGNSPNGGPAVLQLVKIIDSAAMKLAQVFPAASPMAEEIQNQLRLAQQKMAETMSPQQPAAPPV